MSVSPQVSARISNASLVAAVAVAFLHFGVESGQADAATPVRLLLRDFSRFAVPYFFLVSGFLLAGHVEEPGWWCRETVKRLRTILVPYLVWSLLFGLFMLAAVAVPELRRSQSFDLSAWWQAKRFLLPGLDLCEPPLLLPLWYLRTLMLLVGVSDILVRLLRGAPRVTLSFLGLAYLAYSVMIDRFPDLVAYDAVSLVRQTISPEALFFFSFGLWLRGRAVVETRIRAWPFLSVAVALLVLRQLVGGVPYALVVPFALVGVWRAVPETPWPRALTTLSFPVYLIHYFFVILLVRGFPDAFSSGMRFAVAAFGIVVASALVGSLLRRFPPPFAAILFGER